MKNIPGFIAAVGRLKSLKRTGWVKSGIKDAESVADHSFRAAVLAFALAPKSIDKDKCVRMALIHDFGESIVGDITPDEEKRKGKPEAERKAISKLAGLAGSPEILSIWLEFEKGKSPEARFVCEVDRLEMLLQAYEYRKSNSSVDFREFIDYAKARIKSKALLKLASEYSNL